MGCVLLITLTSVLHFPQEQIQDATTLQPMYQDELLQNHPFVLTATINTHTHIYIHENDTHTYTHELTITGFW